MNQRVSAQNLEPDASPRGREAVMNALLDAAEELLHVKSPKQISVREIAELAAVKHPLIHRHFGTKDNLINAAHTRAAERIGREVEEIDDIAGNAAVLLRAVGKNKFRQVAVVRALLDGIRPDEIKFDFPVMKRVLELLRQRAAERPFKSGRSPELMTAFLAAAALGWFVHEPYLVVASGLKDADRDEVFAQIVQIFDEIVDKLC